MAHLSLPRSTINSMTGFSSVTECIDGVSITVEIKSVNHRFLEVSFKLSDNLRFIEIRLKDKIKKLLQRGKVDCFVKLEFQNNPCSSLSLNYELASAILDAAGWIQKKNQTTLINVIDILQWPGVIKTEPFDTSNIESLVLNVFDKSVRSLLEMREREGLEIKKTILHRLELIEIEIQKVKKMMPNMIEWQNQKLRKKLEELNQEFDTARLEQELVYLIQRIDVAEELDRLAMHIKETYQVLERKDSIGRRLDFLMQEFNREANTLASKSISSEVSQSAVEIKVLIEQMREQIQNIE